jgi:hypothetical protein
MSVPATMPNLPQPSSTAVQLGLPNLPGASLPNVVSGPPSAQSLMQQQVLNSQSDLNRLRSQGDVYQRIAHPIDPSTGQPTTSAPSLLRRLGGILGQVGDTVYSSYLPGAAALTPGTTANNLHLQRLDQANINAGLESQNEAARTAEEQALADFTQQRPDIEQSKLDMKQSLAQGKLTEMFAGMGRKVTGWDENGIPITEIDYDSPQFALEQAKAAMHQSITEKNNLQAEIQAKHYIPGTEEYNQWRQKMDQVDKRLQMSLVSLGNAQQRLQLRKNDQQANFYGLGPDGKALPNAPLFQDDAGNITVGGLKGAKTAITQQGNAVGYRDLGGSIAHAKAAIAALHASGDDLSDPLIVEAMSNPTSTIGKVINGKLVKGNLSDAQVSAIGALNQLREQAGLLRAATKGTASEGATERVLETIPTAGDNAATANNKFAEMEGVYNRLTPGVVTIGGGLSVGGKGGKQGNRAARVSAGVPEGATHIAPASDGKDHYINAQGKDLGIVP